MKKCILTLLLALCFTQLAAQYPYPESQLRRRTLLRSLPVSGEDIIFLGNSITQGGEWAELLDNPLVKNRGIGGDRAEWIFDRLDYLINGKPAKLFIMIGINDLNSGRSPEDVAADIGRIVELFAEGSPGTEIFVQSILPMNDDLRPKASERMHLVPAANDAIRKMCEEKGVAFLNVYPLFTDRHEKLDAAYSLDGLHLTGEGYLRWAEYLKPYVNGK